VGGEPAGSSHAHGIPTPAQEEHGERVVLEVNNPDDPLGAVGVVRGEALEPRVEPLGGDLDDSSPH
jgi:hypothetical protein